jgi:hypothetical protein
MHDDICHTCNTVLPGQNFHTYHNGRQRNSLMEALPTIYYAYAFLKSSPIPFAKNHVAAGLAEPAAHTVSSVISFKPCELSFPRVTVTFATPSIWMSNYWNLNELLHCLTREGLTCTSRTLLRPAPYLWFLVCPTLSCGDFGPCGPDVLGLKNPSVNLTIILRVVLLIVILSFIHQHPPN